MIEAALEIYKTNPFLGPDYYQELEKGGEAESRYGALAGNQHPLIVQTTKQFKA
jgi:hypothetical protein